MNVTIICECSYEIGLGHFKRATTFLEQTAKMGISKNIELISFGNYHPSDCNFNKELRIEYNHFNSFIESVNFVNDTYVFLQKSIKDNHYLVLDININSSEDRFNELENLRNTFTTIGFYSQVNYYSSLPFDYHINPNYFLDTLKIEATNNTSNTYLFGTKYRLFTNDFIDVLNQFKNDCVPSNSVSKFKFPSTQILIIAGNTDPLNRIETINTLLSKLKSIDLCNFHIVIPQRNKTRKNEEFYFSSSNDVVSDFQSITPSSAQITPSSSKEVYKFNYYFNTTQKELLKLYPILDGAITAVGGTFWELKQFEIPCLLIPGSESESKMAEWLNELEISTLLLKYDQEFDSSTHTKIEDFLFNLTSVKNNTMTTKDPNILSTSVANNDLGTNRIWAQILQHSFSLPVPKL